jgi:hypothetical protein
MGRTAGKTHVSRQAGGNFFLGADDEPIAGMRAEVQIGRVTAERSQSEQKLRFIPRAIWLPHAILPVESRIRAIVGFARALKRHPSRLSTLQQTERRYDARGWRAMDKFGCAVVKSRHPTSQEPARQAPRMPSVQSSRNLVCLPHRQCSISVATDIGNGEPSMCATIRAS